MSTLRILLLALPWRGPAQHQRRGDLRPVRLRPTEHERFVNSVLNGKKDMPPWRGVLRPDQVEEVWAYIGATVDR
jgi:mono/diheme cytochrome c family protein